MGGGGEGGATDGPNKLIELYIQLNACCQKLKMRTTSKFL